MLNSYNVRFYDDKDHQKGTITTITAVDKGQAIIFFDMIAKELDYKWSTYTSWEFVNC